jgi:UDP-GlcNAc:undecaprenyl-phosphate/decaprenyl-phosphate GlcNAc-1-phosphate transferase
VNIALVYAAACLSAALATALSVPFWRRWCLKSGAMDDPGHRKIHTSPIPLAGGMAVMTGLMVSLLIGVVVALAGSRSSVAGLFEYGLSVRTTQLLGLTAGALGMLMLGLHDDKSELTPLLKFAGQLLVALVVAAAGMRITLFVPSLLFSYGMTAVWILTVVNAFNFMDNMNGLCAGLGAISAGWLGLIAAGQGQYLVATMAFLFAGALLGFLPFNFPRAAAFLGDAGSHLTGYLLAVLAILPHYYTHKHPRRLAVLTPLLVLAVPLGDMVWVVLLRWKNRQPFYVGDTNHLSHRLVRCGFTPVRAVVLIWLLAAAAGALAFLLQ